MDKFDMAAYDAACAVPPKERTEEHHRAIMGDKLYELCKQHDAENAALLAHLEKHERDGRRLNLFRNVGLLLVFVFWVWASR